MNDDQNITVREHIRELSDMALARGYTPREFDGGLTVICDAVNRGGHIIALVLAQRYHSHRDGVSGYMIAGLSRADHLFNTHKPI